MSTSKDVPEVTRGFYCVTEFHASSQLFELTSNIGKYTSLPFKVFDSTGKIQKNLDWEEMKTGAGKTLWQAESEDGKGAVIFVATKDAYPTEEDVNSITN